MSRFKYVPKREKSLLTNSRGFSLVGVLVASAAIGGIALGAGRLMTNMSISQKQLAQKLDMIALQGAMSHLVSNLDYCSSQLQDSPTQQRRLDVTSVTESRPSSAPLNLSVLRASTGTDAPILAQAGQRLPNTGTIIERVELSDILLLSGNLYTGTVRVFLNPGEGGMSRHPASVPGVTFAMDTTTPTSARITNCAFAPAAAANAMQTMIVLQQYPVYTNGGDINTYVWYNRDLNTIRENTIVGATLTPRSSTRTVATQRTSDAHITLPAGRYFIRAQAHGDSVQDHKARWYNIDNNSTVLMGTTAYAYGGNGTESFVTGSFEITAPTRFALQHIGSRNCADTGLCTADSFGFLSSQGGNFGCTNTPPYPAACADMVEIYAMVEIQKLQ